MHNGQNYKDSTISVGYVSSLMFIIKVRVKNLTLFLPVITQELSVYMYYLPLIFSNSIYSGSYFFFLQLDKIFMSQKYLV